MSTALVVEIILGLLTAAIAGAAYFAATRANRAQSDATKMGVDAAAYSRARELYESAITAQGSSLRGQITDLSAEVTRLRLQGVDLSAEVTRLRLQGADLSAEVTALRALNTDLRQQIAVLKREAGGT